MIYYKGRQIDEINAYNVEGTTLNNQSKEIEINKNGETIITYDEGYTGLEQVTVNVNVASQGGEGGNSFSVIGYPSVPQYIQDGIDYAKTIQDNWNASDINREYEFKDNAQLLFFPQVDTSNLKYATSMFSGCKNLQFFPHINASNVINMADMFYNCNNLISIDTSSWDTSNVNNLFRMFYGCSGLTSLDVSSFNTSAVNNMSSVFSYCSGLTSLDLSNWDTSNVNNMGSMFDGCSGLTSLDVSSFNTSAVTTMNSMFDNCRSLTSLDVSSFNTSAVTNMGSMFDYCSGLTSLDLSNFDTSKVTNMSYMFNECRNLTSLDLSSFNTSNVTNMRNMFYCCYKLQRIDGYLDWSKISSYPTYFITSNSTNSYPLRYMTIKNLGKTGTTFNFNNTNLQNWGDESNTTTYPLSVGARQSLVDSLLTYSYDRAANGLSNCKIQLDSKVKARLTADEITAIKNKGYTIS